MLGWEKYPIALPRTVRGRDDVHDLEEQLQQKCEFLFVSDPSKVKLDIFIQGAGMLEESPHPSNPECLTAGQRTLAIFLQFPLLKIWNNTYRKYKM